MVAVVLHLAAEITETKESKRNFDYMYLSVCICVVFAVLVGVDVGEMKFILQFHCDLFSQRN